MAVAHSKGQLPYFISYFTVSNVCHPERVQPTALNLGKITTLRPSRLAPGTSFFCMGRGGVFWVDVGMLNTCPRILSFALTKG